MTTEPHPDSVQEAVAREAARRKRVFLAFLGLLLLPIGIGAYALSRSPTETAKVAADVAPIVTEQVSREIATRVTDDVVTRAEPIVRENVSREVSAVLEPRIASATSALRGEITSLQASVQQTSALVRSAGPQLAAVPELNNRLSSSVRTATANREAIVSLTRQLAAMEDTLKSLNARVSRLEAANKEQGWR